MKVGNVGYYNSVQPNIKNKYSNKQNFSGRRFADEEIMTLIPDYKNALERAVQKVGFFEEYKPKSFIDMLLHNGNKIRMVFQRDGKTLSHSTEISKEGKDLRFLYFDRDGQTKLVEILYNKDGKPLRTLYYSPSDGHIIKEKINK